VAYDEILASAGNRAGVSCDGEWFDRRDSIDKRVVNDVRNGTGRIIDDPSQVGGWITPATGVPCDDSDHDGMPDAWENRYGFNPNSNADANADADGDGYANVEEAINGTNPSNGQAPIELTVNGAFETYPASSKTPTRWSAIQFTVNDGKDTNVKNEGAASVKIVGSASVLKIINQTLLVSGNAGEALNFSVWAKGNSIPTQTVCSAMLILYKAGVEVGRKSVVCPTGTYAFQKLSATFAAPDAFDKINIRLRFKSTGTIWFDTVSLTK
jgi:hypothetical protein